MNNQPKTYETPQTITIDSIAQRAIFNVLLEPVLKTRPKKRRQLALMKLKAAVASMVMAQYIYTSLEAGKETGLSSNHEPNLACHCLLIALCYQYQRWIDDGRRMAQGPEGGPRNNGDCHSENEGLQMSWN